MSASEPVPETGKVDILGLTPVCGLCCNIGSCYTDWPECCGMSCGGELLCGDCDFSCCKRGLSGRECCSCFKGQCACVSPQVCIKSQQQICCIDMRASLPCEPEEVPCILNVCFINFCYKWGCNCGCCASIEDLEKKYQLKNPPQVHVAVTEPK